MNSAYGICANENVICDYFVVTHSFTMINEQETRHEIDGNYQMTHKEKRKIITVFHSSIGSSSSKKGNKQHHCCDDWSTLRKSFKLIRKYLVVCFHEFPLCAKEETNLFESMNRKYSSTINWSMQMNPTKSCNMRICLFLFLLSHSKLVKTITSINNWKWI